MTESFLSQILLFEKLNVKRSAYRWFNRWVLTYGTAVFDFNYFATKSFCLINLIILRKNQKQEPGIRRSRAFVTLLSSQLQVCFAQNRCAKD